MVKKIINISLVVLGLGLILFLILHNLYSFVDTTNRLKEILNPFELKNFFEIYNETSTVIYEESIKEITKAIEGAIESIQEATNKPFEEILLDFLEGALDFGFNFIIYFCNYGLNGIMITYILLHENINGTQISIKTSPLAGIYLTISKTLSSVHEAIKMAINRLLRLLYNQRRKIALALAVITLSNGLLYKILVEFLIFLITYIIRMINLETYLVMFSIAQSLFTFVYPKLKYIPSWLWIPLLIIVVFLNAIARATYKLKKNHQRLKDFANDDLTQTTFINGPPGTGKTLLNVSLSLASEENYIEELEKKLLDYEMQYKYLNFAKIRENPDDFPEHKEYTDAYKLLTTRGTFLISNYAIYSPLFNQYSKIFNFDYMRVNQHADIYPLEEYIVISISEFDKEYNSHDDKKIVGSEGPATFFSTVSHNLKRHTKIFVDYQLKDQVPLRIRGNSEYFITIKERKKKYPILLGLYYFPFKLIYKILRHFIKKYELKKINISKKSMRKTVGCYKRNDFTLPYVILRDAANTFKKICDWFDSFYYFTLKTLISQEGEDGKGIRKKLNINIRDLSYKNQALYDSTFLSFAYEQKKNEEFKNLDTFTKLTPPIEELNKCNSKFYNKING